VHPDAPANPLYHQLKELLDFEKTISHDFRRLGKLRTMQVAEHNEQIVKNSLIETQNICLPTLNNLRNVANISQLQERVYQTLTPHFDALNICIMRSRTAFEADHCFNQYLSNFNSNFKPALKNILLDY
jgi:hypothetical protein